MRLEVVVIRSAGDILTDSRSEVFFEISLVGEKSPETAADDDSSIVYRTATKKRSHILDFRAKSDSIEFGDLFNVPLKDASGRLLVVCVKKGAPIGQALISLESLPNQQSGRPVQKWFQLQDGQKRNISALVFLKLRLHQHSAVSLQLGRFGRGPASSHQKGQTVSPVSLQSPTNLNVFPIATSGNRRQKSLSLRDSAPNVLFEYAALLSLGSTAAVLDKYPAADRAACAFPDLGLLADMCSAPPQLRRCCFSFFLSNSGTYGTAYIFRQDGTEMAASDTASEGAEPDAAAAPSKAIVLLSRFGFCSSFQSMLIDLFGEMDPDPVQFSGKVLAYIRFLCDSVHSPIQGGKALRLHSPFSKELSWRLRLPDSLCQFQLPLLDYSVLFLLRLMDISTVLMAISSILTGKSIVIHSSQLSLLLPVCECLLSLIFPFRWTNVYVPVLPRGILQVLDSPVPFIVGTLSANLKSVQLAAHCVVVDIDMSNVTSESSLVLLPAQPTKLLCRQVRRAIFQQSLFQADQCSTISERAFEPNPSMAPRQENAATEREVRFCFMRYICSLLHDYRKYLRFDSANDTHFDSATFLEQRMDARPFLSRFIQTQMFSEFLELHVETPSLLDDFLYYSAECVTDSASPEIDVRMDSPPNEWPKIEPIAFSALYYKDRQECGKAADQSRLSVLIRELMRPVAESEAHETISVADLYSIAELLCFPHWRMLFIDVVLGAVHADGRSWSNPASQPTVQIALDRYTALAFLFCRGLEQSVESPRDYGFARKCILGAALQIGGRLPKSPDNLNKPSMVLLKDSIKHCMIWKLRSFWEYHLSLTVLQNTMGGDHAQNFVEAPTRKSRAESMPQSVEHFIPLHSRPRSAEEEDFIFGEMCSLLSLLQSLEISRSNASKITLYLSRLWHFDEAQINDITTLINNVYKAQPEENVHSNRGSPRFPDLFGTRSVPSPVRSASTLPLSPVRRILPKLPTRSQSF